MQTIIMNFLFQLKCQNVPDIRICTLVVLVGALFIKQQQGAVTVTAREAAQCSVTKRQRKNIWKERKMHKKNIWKI